MTIAMLNSTDATAASATPAMTDPIGGNHDGSMDEAQVTFHYDVGSPWCWLAGERVTHVLGVVPVWQPVLAAGLPAALGAQAGRAALDAGPGAQGLPPPPGAGPRPVARQPAMRAAALAEPARGA